jgi:EAL domain-containing protein (putative c-di-GMP-specific phosphodiesterase class I)
MMPVLTAVALVVALVAAAAALRAVLHVSRLRADILLLARSIDVALRDISERTDKEPATIGDTAGRETPETEKFSERIGTPEDAGSKQLENTGNVVPHPSARRTRSVQQEPVGQPRSGPDVNSVDSAYKKAIAAGEFEIALQPIVSVSRSAAIGFDVYASLPVEGGERIELRRPAKRTERGEAAAFERILIATTLQAGRKRLGAASVNMPLHAAVSEAILSDSKELGAVLELLQLYPNLARSFVLSAPTILFDPSSEHRQALDLLAAKGVRFAAEGWSEAGGADQPRYAEAIYLKLSANRLLDREHPGRKLTPATTIIEQATADKLAIIATKVATDEDAVALLDLGIDLMSGPRFGGPKRLKPETGNRPGRLALI